jgi:hypothetical protein
MKRPFDPSVDCHIDFLQHHVNPEIASGAARLLIGAQEALLNAQRQVGAAIKAKLSEPEVAAVLGSIAAEAAQILDGVESEAAGYFDKLGQLEGRPDSAARQESRDVRQAHSAVAYVVREKRSELEKLISAVTGKGTVHAA